MPARLTTAKAGCPDSDPAPAPTTTATNGPAILPCWGVGRSAVSWDAVRVLELGPSSGLTDREFRLLLVLADRLNKRTGQLNPAARRTRDIGLEPTRSAVRSAPTLADLEAQGWLQRVGSSKGGQEGRRYLSQSYRLRGDLMSPLRGDTDLG